MKMFENLICFAQNGHIFNFKNVFVTIIGILTHFINKYKAFERF